jgi:hypothetical protein
MKKTIKHTILNFLVFSLLAISCQIDETVQLNSSESNDIITDYFSGDMITKFSSDSSNSNISKLSSLTKVTTSMLSVDSDGDGISDYAEQKIGLNKNNASDVSSLEASSVIGLISNNGFVIRIPFYQTSFYQNSFCVPSEPTFGRTLTTSNIEIIQQYYPYMLKIFRTAEFQNYILNKEAGKKLGLDFINKTKNIKRKIHFSSFISGGSLLGTSDSWSTISFNKIVLDRKLSDPYSIAEVMPHEFIHHLGYTHQYDYAYGGGVKAKEMFDDDKHLYRVYNLEDEATYTMTVPEPKKALNGSKSDVVFLADVTFLTPSANILTNNKVSGNFVSNQKLVFTQGKGGRFRVKNLFHRQIISIWIDFNNDSIYTDDEKIVNNKAAISGTSYIHFIIPAKAHYGKHYMRLNSSPDNPRAYGPNDMGTSIDFTNVFIN